MKICGPQNQNGNAILQGAGSHDAFFLNGVFWHTEQTYHTLEQLAGPNNLPVVAENAGSFC
jgi:hypothetical protein